MKKTWRANVREEGGVKRMEKIRESRTRRRRELRECMRRKKRLNEENNER